MSTFCQRLYHRKCQRRGVGGQKSQNLVNVVCERPLRQRLGAENGDKSWNRSQFLAVALGIICSLPTRAICDT